MAGVSDRTAAYEIAYKMRTTKEPSPWGEVHSAVVSADASLGLLLHKTALRLIRAADAMRIRAAKVASDVRADSEIVDFNTLSSIDKLYVVQQYKKFVKDGLMKNDARVKVAFKGKIITHMPTTQILERAHNDYVARECQVPSATWWAAEGHGYADDANDAGTRTHVVHVVFGHNFTTKLIGTKKEILRAVSALLSINE